MAGYIRGVAGRERHELIAAAHTLLVVSAVFDAFSAEIGTRFKALELTDEEKMRLVGPAPTDQQPVGPASADHGQRALVDLLISAELPLPSATCGFEENLFHRIAPRMHRLIDGAITFFHGLAAWDRIRRDVATAGLSNRL